jgi:nicotinamidase-related amidase
MSTTNLEEQLQGKGIDTLVLAGIATSGVVLSTVRAGADKDFRILVLSDLCLDADPQVHQVLIEKVFPRQAWVMSSEDFLTLI